LLIIPAQHTFYVRAAFDNAAISGVQHSAIRFAVLSITRKSERKGTELLKQVAGVCGKPAEVISGVSSSRARSAFQFQKWSFHAPSELQISELKRCAG
jgi:hypothetical protein